VSLADVLLGRREPRRARADLVQGIAAARLNFELELDARAAAIAFDPRGDREGFDALIASVAEDIGATVERRQDRFGLTWVGLSGAGLDDLALSIGVLAQSLELAGFWEQVVCAVFEFRKKSNPAARVHWIYNFARGTFYPLVSHGHRRNSAEEARLMAAAEHDLRLERDPQLRYPLWDIPVW
jgi:PspAB-like protein